MTLAQGSRLKVVRITSSMLHAQCLFWSLFDSPLCTLHRLSHLPFHSPENHLHLPCGLVWEKFPVRFRKWGVRHFGRQHSSHRLWAQRARQLPDLRDHWNLHPGVSQRQQALELAWLGNQWLHHRQNALSSPLFIQEREDQASRRQAYHSPDESLLTSQSLSVGHVRTGRLNSNEFGSLTSEKTRVATQKMSNSGFFWNDKKSRFSLIKEQRFKNTSSKPIVTEEISSNSMELSSLIEVRLIVLFKETNNFDEINNFFMYNYWNKIGIFVKLMRKVSMRWKNWSDFKALHSIQFQGENWSKIEILSLISQGRFRNYRMKLIAWMIREILKMLNQFAVDNPTLPVNLRFSHLFKILSEC